MWRLYNRVFTYFDQTVENNWFISFAWFLSATKNPWRCFRQGSYTNALNQFWLHNYKTRHTHSAEEGFSSVRCRFGVARLPGVSSLSHRKRRAKFYAWAGQHCIFSPFESKHLNEAQESFSLTTAVSSVIDCSVNYSPRWVRFTPNRWQGDRRTRNSDILLPTHLLRVCRKLQQDILSKNVPFSFLQWNLSSKLQTKTVLPPVKIYAEIRVHNGN